MSLDLNDDLGTLRFNERRRRSRRWTLGSLAAAVVAPPARALAAPPLGEPRGEVILTVTGRIDVTNGDGVARLDRELLLGMGTAELTTSTPFTEGASKAFLVGVFLMLAGSAIVWAFLDVKHEELATDGPEAGVHVG